MAFGQAGIRNNPAIQMHATTCKPARHRLDFGYQPNASAPPTMDTPFHSSAAPTLVGPRGADTRIRFAIGQSALGTLLVAASPRGVCAISLGEDADTLVHALQERFPHAQRVGNDPAFSTLVAQVAGLVENPAQGVDLPLDLRGTPFQLRVWHALREIPAGSRLSYTELARRLGLPRAARAVAGACAANTLAVAVPCHRVVRNDGGLASYRWGVERKQALLEREAQP